MNHIAYIIENEVVGTWDEAKALCEENELPITAIKTRTAQEHGQPSFVARQKDAEIETGTFIYGDYLEAVRASLDITDGETVIWMGAEEVTEDGRFTA